MKYLRLFETEAEYSAATLDYPNVAYISATDRVAMEKDAPTPVATYKARLTLQDTSTVDIPLNGSSTLTSAETSGYLGTCVAAEITTAVTTIGERAFSAYMYLSSITIPSSVTSISERAFAENYSLSSITLPDSITTIGMNAFNDCSSLSSITIPSGVTSIGDYTFMNCGSLESVTIGNGVTTIGDNAFSYCGLQSITIPNGVTTIGNNVFEGCTSLSNITIGSGVTSIGDGVFQYCSSLFNLTIPSSVTSVGSGIGSGVIQGSQVIYVTIYTTNFDGYPCSFETTIDDPEDGTIYNLPTFIDGNSGDIIYEDWCNDFGCGCNGEECDPCDENGDCYDPCADPDSECYDPSQCEGSEEEPSEE